MLRSMLGFLQLILLLGFLLAVSPSSLDATSISISDNKTEYFTRIVESLSEAEKTGLPEAGWPDPLDPCLLHYACGFLDIVEDKQDIGYLKICLNGFVDGLSNYNTSDINIYDEVDPYDKRNNLTGIDFAATSGPIRINARYAITGRLNKTYIPFYAGTFVLNAESTERQRSFWLYTTPDGSYSQGWHSWSWSNVTDLSLSISNLPDNLTELIVAQDPAKVVEAVTWEYMESLEDFFVDFSNYVPPSRNEFFKRLVDSLPSAEYIFGIPDARRKPIDPLRIYTLSSSLEFSDSIYELGFALSGFLHGASQYYITDFTFTEFSDTELRIEFWATTGPINLEATYTMSTFVPSNFSYFPKKEGTFNLTAESTTRFQWFDVVALPDGSYAVRENIGRPATNATNVSYNVTNLPEYAVKILNLADPSDVVFQIYQQYRDLLRSFFEDLANNPPF